jgi:hypothetical protein
MMKLFNKSDKKVLIQCPYSSEGSKDFCSKKKPYTLDMNSPDFKNLMEAHVQQHIERDSSLFGLTLKRLGCPICDFETAPFQSNNASALKALGREEMEAQIDLDDHITGNHERVDNLVELAKVEQNPEEKQRLIDLIETYRGHKSCALHETPGHEVLTYYFKDDEEKDLHVKLLHMPKIKPINPKLRK